MRVERFAKEVEPATVLGPLNAPMLLALGTGKEGNSAAYLEQRVPRVGAQKVPNVLRNGVRVPSHLLGAGHLRVVEHEHRP